MKFVLVNGRTPRPQSFCSLCCEPIEGSYLRELTTRLSYCDHKCYAGHCKLRLPAEQTYPCADDQMCRGRRTSGFASIDPVFPSALHHRLF